jgi:hypothetical protein
VGVSAPRDLTSARLSTELLSGSGAKASGEALGTSGRLVHEVRGERAENRQEFRFDRWFQPSDLFELRRRDRVEPRYGELEPPDVAVASVSFNGALAPRLKIDQFTHHAISLEPASDTL